MSRPENWRGSVNAPLVPQLGQLTSLRPFGGGLPFFASYASSRWSARNRLWHDWHSTSGSLNVST